MPIYLVTPLKNNFLVIGKKVKSELGIAESDWYSLQGDAGYLVDFPGSALELTRRLEGSGIFDDDKRYLGVGSVLVTGVGTYFGRGEAPMWEWLKSKVEGHVPLAWPFGPRPYVGMAGLKS